MADQTFTMGEEEASFTITMPAAQVEDVLEAFAQAGEYVFTVEKYEGDPTDIDALAAHARQQVIRFILYVAEPYRVNKAVLAAQTAAAENPIQIT